MSIVEVNKIESDIFPVDKGDEIQSIHFKAIRERMWVLEHTSAGNIDTTIQYGKWVGDETHFEYVDYDIHNWAGWNPDTEYHPGFPIVKYRWGPGVDQVDIFVFKGTAIGDILSANPPVVGGKLNGLWLLTVDPNKYSHWNFNAGRPDIDADDRWIISQHGWDDPAFGGEGWLYGLWKAYQELPTDTDPYEQIPYIKSTGSIRARHKPVEQKRSHTTTKLQTQRRRMFQDGYVGIIPNHTWWWDHFSPDMVSEYIRLNGDPIDSIQCGPDYREPKKNLSYQDRIQHLIEQNYNYVVKVDDDWKLAWQYWYVYGQEMDSSHDEGCVGAVYDRVKGGYSNAAGWGPSPGDPPYVSKGDVVWHNNYFWFALSSGGEWYEPGTEAGKDYWATEDDLTPKPLYQPNYLNTHPVYVQFSDPLFYCNSSAFEKVLKNIGKYDWYWDDKFTAVDWWMYQKHYYLMTLHMADPDAGHEQEALKRWPKPRGCWRRVWRHTMNWDKARNQKGRFGKEINIDGKMVAMMWPGEMGTPPGYDQQFDPSKALLDYRGLNPAFHFDDKTYQQIITEAQYDAMDASTFDLWPLFKSFYTVIDVEELFRQAYKNSIWPERRIAERHDPQATDWILVFNEHTGLMESEEVPIFELHHDLVNDMRDALLELKLFGRDAAISIQSNLSTDNEGNIKSTSLASYADAKSIINSNKYMTYGGGPSFKIGYIVCIWSNGPSAYLSQGGGGECARWTEKFWGKLTITQQLEDLIPSKEVGDIVFDVWVDGLLGTQKITDTCEIGIGDLSHQPPANSTRYRIYLGSLLLDCEWVYNVGDEKWEKKCVIEIVPLSPWPDSGYFNYVGGGGECRSWTRQSGVEIAVTDHLAILINFDEYSDDVFSRDETNIIEV